MSVANCKWTQNNLKARPINCGYLRSTHYFQVDLKIFLLYHRPLKHVDLDILSEYFKLNELKVTSPVKISLIHSNFGVKY